MLPAQDNAAEDTYFGHHAGTQNYLGVNTHYIANENKRRVIDG